MIDECGAAGGMRIGRGNRNTRRKSNPLLICQTTADLRKTGELCSKTFQIYHALNLWSLLYLKKLMGYNNVAMKVIVYS
jgi:hypothetical protein